MEFTPKPSTIGTVFLSEKFYLIPKYQRKYVWQNSKIEDLWNDIEFSIQEAGKVSYFLGSFIFQSEKRSTTKIVIDGQQRLTSLLILLATICKKFRELSDDFNTKETYKYCLLGDKKEKIEKPRIINDELLIINYLVDYCCSSEHCSSFLDYLANEHYKQTLTDKQFLFCYDYFTKTIDENLSKNKSDKSKIKYLETLREAVLKILVIEISVEDEKSASLVFETINARGQELETHELIKNYLFTYEKKIKGATVAKQIWDKITENTDSRKSSSLSRFISHYSTTVFGKTADKEIFSVFKKSTPRHQVNSRISHMLEASEIYKNIVLCHCTNYSNKTNYLLKCFSEMGIVIIRPFLLSLFLAHRNGVLDEKKLSGYLETLKNFFSIFVCVCERKTNEIEPLLYEYSYKLYRQFSEETVNELLNILKSKIVSESAFTEAFSTLAFTKHKDLYPNVKKFNKQKCQYVLKEFEMYLQQNDDYIITEFSIEHIKDDCLGEKACFIGNMIPLPKGKNNKLSGKDYLVKQKAYKNSCYLSARKLSENPHLPIWDDGKIDNRTTHLASEFYKNIWKIS